MCQSSRRANNYNGVVGTTDEMGLSCTTTYDNYGHRKLIWQSFFMRVKVIHARLLALESSLTTQLAAMVFIKGLDASYLVATAVMTSYVEMVAQDIEDRDGTSSNSGSRLETSWRKGHIAAAPIPLQNAAF